MEDRYIVIEGIKKLNKEIEDFANENDEIGYNFERLLLLKKLNPYDYYIFLMYMFFNHKISRLSNFLKTNRYYLSKSINEIKKFLKK